MQVNRLHQQLQFIIEIDQLKNVLRQTLLIDGSRRENSGEHSWHLAMMTMILAEYAPEERVFERGLVCSEGFISYFVSF
ncbi:HD domain-containing protein [Calothrix sp. CCY 0018]|uniref:HD domain-containing protein n=1 Tax=Calothrix sp. CCY 0018 TaxID=3103864 RepID=UPI0039C6ECE0